jgi:hypothetical protein
MTLYCTYYQNGSLRRAVLSQRQYEMYSKDPAISQLVIHGSQQLMETAYNQAKGVSGVSRTLLHG